MKNVVRESPVSTFNIATYLVIVLSLIWVSDTLAQQACIQPPAGLVGWWPGNGNASDIVGVNHGALASGVDFVPGHVDQAFSFNGADGRVNIPDAPGLRPQQLTLEAWVKLDANNLEAIIGRQFGSSFLNSYQIFVLNGELGGIISNGASNVGLGDGASPNSGIPVPLGQFVHVAMTWDGNELRLYLNGALGASRVVGPIVIAYDNNEVNLGADHQSPSGGPYSVFLDGVIDEAGIYNRALTGEEIQNIFNAGSAGKCRPSPFIFRKIAATGDPVPGGAGTFTSLGYPALDGGNVVFYGNDSVGAQGIYKFTATTATLSTVANHLTIIPGQSGGFLGFSAASSINGEDAAFWGYGLRDDGTYVEGIYTEVGGSLKAVVESGDPVPGLPDEEFNGFSVIHSIDSGEVALLGFVRKSEGLDPDTGREIFSNVWGVYMTNGGMLDVVADTLNTPVPGGSGNFSWLNFPSLDRGNVTFAGYDGASYGIYSDIGGSLTAVADNSTQVPEGLAAFRLTDHPSIDGEEMAFYGCCPAGIYTKINGTLAPVATTDTPIPPGEGNFQGFGYPSIHNGKIAFLAFHRASDGRYLVGVYTTLGGALEKVIAADDTLDGKTVSSTYSFREALSGSSIAFFVLFTDGSQGIYVASRDGDSDTVPDDHDNCPNTANPGQEDSDMDDIGDACQDTDGDTVLDIDDNCPLVANVGQDNSDADLWGDACDNCDLINNPGQTDTDMDDIGDACDPDVDNDGFDNMVDLCPQIPDDQSDLDGDGVGDACDDDIDGDSIANVVDGTFDGVSFTDQSTTFSDNFTDEHLGGIGIGFGTISSRGGSLEFRINNTEDVNEGVRIDTFAGSGSVQLRLCGSNKPTKFQDPGSSVAITCGSQTLNVQGTINPVEFEFAPDVFVLFSSGAKATIETSIDESRMTETLEVETAIESAVATEIAIGNDIVVKVPAAATTTVTEQDDQLEIENSPDSLVPITIEVQGQVLEIGAGETQTDFEPPITSGVLADPNPVEVNAPITLTANVDDTMTGGSVVAAAAYKIDAGTSIQMASQDGSFDGVSEQMTADLPPFADAGVHNVCVQGRDESGNIGTGECILLAVYDPDGGFVTGGGWIDSPAGAYAPDPSLAGKANFGFVSKYKKGSAIPTGNTEFQFKAGDLNFHSTSYDWLVVTGNDYAQFKGLGSVNGMGSYKFMLWAGDGNSDTLRIKIWQENGGETVVYDNGFDQAIGGGSIVIHTK